MLGKRQRQIVELLGEGPHSISALMLRLGAKREDERRLVHDVLHRLEAHGLIRVYGHTRADLRGCMVALAKPGSFSG
jgi:hypothetical protein